MSAYLTLKAYSTTENKGFKKCCSCEILLPKNEKYFFKKKSTWVTKEGLFKEKDTYRSYCKKCHGKKATERRILKRIKELNCTKEDYNTAWRKEIGLQKIKYKELFGLKQSKLQYIRKCVDKGYQFKSLEQWEIDKKIRNHEKILKSRKYDYSHNNKLSIKESNDMQIKEITKSRVCNNLKIKTKELPDYLYENIKITLKIKRELGLTNKK